MEKNEKISEDIIFTLYMAQKARKNMPESMKKISDKIIQECKEKLQKEKKNK